MKANNVENNWNAFITDNDDLTRVCRRVKELNIVMREAHAIGVISRAHCNEIIAFLCTS